MRREAEERDAVQGGLTVSVKQIGLVMGLVFAVTLAVIVAKQMSTEAMAVVIGIVCGVAAGIPTSVLLLVVLTRRDRQRLEETEGRARQTGYPPVIVIQGGTPQPLAPSPPAGYWPAPQSGPPARRQFHVVGGDDLLLDDGPWSDGS
jgi:hypothetical protein